MLIDFIVCFLFRGRLFYDCLVRGLIMLDMIGIFLGWIFLDYEVKLVMWLEF